MTRFLRPALVSLCLLAIPSADPLHPMVDFSLAGPDGTLLKNTATIDGLLIRAYVKGGNEQWNHPPGAKLRVVNDGAGDQGLGICSPKDLADGVCSGGEIDEAGQREMIRIRKPTGQRITAVWLSSMDGVTDNARLGVSDLPDPDPGNITWHTEVFARQWVFFPDLPSARIPLPLDGRCTTYLWVQAAAGQPGNSNFLVWGVDLEANEW